jgi:hypothetical protein
MLVCCSILTRLVAEEDFVEIINVLLFYFHMLTMQQCSSRTSTKVTILANKTVFNAMHIFANLFNFRQVYNTGTYFYYCTVHTSRIYKPNKSKFVLHLHVILSRVVFCIVTPCGFVCGYVPMFRRTILPPSSASQPKRPPHTSSLP